MCNEQIVVYRLPFTVSTCLFHGKFLKCFALGSEIISKTSQKFRISACYGIVAGRLETYEINYFYRSNSRSLGTDKLSLLTFARI